MAVAANGVLSGDAGKGSATTTALGAAVGFDEGVEAGLVWLTDPLHPNRARIVRVPRRSEAP